jgi:hypothetical protein
MPVGLRNADRERLLGQMWSARKLHTRTTSSTTAPSGTPFVAPPTSTTAAPLAFSGAGQTPRGAPGATSPSTVPSGAGSAAATTREQASLDAAQARRP